MALLLFLLGLIFVSVSVYLFAADAGALSEILAGMSGLAAAVLIGCAFIVDAVNQAVTKLSKETNE